MALGLPVLRGFASGSGAAGCRRGGRPHLCHQDLHPGRHQDDRHLAVPCLPRQGRSCRAMGWSAPDMWHRARRARGDRYGVRPAGRRDRYAALAPSPRRGADHQRPVPRGDRPLRRAACPDGCRARADDLGRAYLRNERRHFRALRVGTARLGHRHHRRRHGPGRCPERARRARPVERRRRDRLPGHGREAGSACQSTVIADGGNRAGAVSACRSSARPRRDWQPRPVLPAHALQHRPGPAGPAWSGPFGRLGLPGPAGRYGLWLERGILRPPALAPKPGLSAREHPAAQPDRSQSDRGQLDRGQLDRGQLDRGQLDRGQLDRGQPWPVAPGKRAERPHDAPREEPLLPLWLEPAQRAGPRCRPHQYRVHQCRVQAP
jgi:hypothetical protein